MCSRPSLYPTNPSFRIGRCSVVRVIPVGLNSIVASRSVANSLVAFFADGAGFVTQARARGKDTFYRVEATMSK